tara:strand:- start:74 stop:691 length:618 start_codon:yes stop_codon:yes gene_type:complete
MKITNEDNIQLMSRYEDNYFDLAIVDPPYGIADNSNNYKGSGKLKNRILNKSADKFSNWDSIPNKKYFDELFRVSKNQIIWGANYFDLPKYRCVIAWDKMQPFPNFSAIEIAFTSFNKPAKIYKFDNRYSGKIHPTQKPVKLYEWLLVNFAKEGDKILDTHLGSGSIAIACHNFGFDLTACELDKEYFDASMKRLKQHQSQLRLI